MAITTLDGALAGMKPQTPFFKTGVAAPVVGRPHSFWAANGFPGPGAYDTTLNGVALAMPLTGALDFQDPPSGQNSYLALLEAAANIPGMLILADRLWHNGGITITSTSAQTIVSPTFPARDNNGSSNGYGVQLGVEVSAVTGSGAPSVAVSYTNSDGVAGRTATLHDATAASSAAGNFFRMRLQAGDKGVRSVQSIQLGATWTSGTINLVAYRPLATLGLQSANLPNARDALTGGFPRIYDDAVLFFLEIPNTATAITLSGQLGYTQG